MDNLTLEIVKIHFLISIVNAMTEYFKLRQLHMQLKSKEKACPQLS